MLCLVCIWTKFLTRQTIALLFAQHSTLQYSSLNVACCMAFPVKREAIAVWDIENTRVPTKLLTRCNDIVKWLLEDIQAQCPNTTVLKIYVAGTFDNYPVTIKTALCTHPRVQLLYSVGKVPYSDTFYPPDASVCTHLDMRDVLPKRLHDPSTALYASFRLSKGERQTMHSRE